MDAFLHGALLAFGLILPLGVQNVFIFNQGAQQPSFWRSLPAIITAIICDTILILLAVAGISAIILTFKTVKLFFMGAGVLFLLYMGWSIWSSKTNPNADTSYSIMRPKQQILFSASVSLLNPHAILDTIGVIGISSIAYTGSDKLVFTFSCILVSWLWFIGLALAGRLVGKIDTSGRIIIVVNKLSALIIWFLAFYITITLVQSI
ncbi:LysE family transporter [Fictibacillus nanhaiensis]|uniref:LysE family transporter n=1 Tax=Fictibacillus nanhaiensis TaxID=742169 RepID=A0ABS2ZSZ9_9BACL|nr:LysE family transporter [Fictibacillus nanhaiensis]